MNALDGLLGLLYALVAVFTFILLMLAIVLFVFGFLIGLLAVAACNCKGKALSCVIVGSVLVGLVLSLLVGQAGWFIFCGCVVGGLVGTKLNACDY